MFGDIFDQCLRKIYQIYETSYHVDETDDVDFYTSVKDAEISMEPIDVGDRIFKVYDSEGYLLKIDISAVLPHRRKFLFFDVVDTTGAPTLKDFEEGKSHLEELIPILKSFCKKNSIDVKDHASLSDILKAVKEKSRIIPP